MLTLAQLAVLRTAIAADQNMNSKPNTPDGAVEISQYLAQPNPVDYYVWKSFVARNDIYTAILTDNPAAPQWSWPAYIGRSANELDAWKQMTGMDQGLNPALPQVRQGISDIFSGSGIAATQRNFLAAIGRRKATRAETMFAVASAGGVGTRGSVVNPDTLGVEGTISPQDISTARQAP